MPKKRSKGPPRGSSHVATVVRREISRSSKRQRPETEHWSGLNRVLTKTKKKVSGPNPPDPHLEVPFYAPKSQKSGGGKIVRRMSRG